MPDRTIDLRRGTVAGSSELLKRVKRARKRIGAKAKRVADDPRYARSMRLREQWYGEIHGVYDRLAVELDTWIEELVEKTAVKWHGNALADVAQGGGTVASATERFDRNRVRKYWQIVHPDNRASLAATYTQHMARSDIGHLRGALVDAFRQQQLEGWTNNQLQKEIQDRWDKLAGNMLGDRFRDAAGRKWTNASYLQMLVRTTQARTARESYIDTLIADGDRLGRIVSAGENCPICDAWAGVIVALTDTGAKYPTYQQAVDAGWGHPNCDCHLEYVNELIDEADIERQEGAPTPSFDRAPNETDHHYARRVAAAVKGYKETWEK